MSSALYLISSFSDAFAPMLLHACKTNFIELDFPARILVACDLGLSIGDIYFMFASYLSRIPTVPWDAYHSPSSSSRKINIFPRSRINFIDIILDTFYYFPDKDNTNGREHPLMASVALSYTLGMSFGSVINVFANFRAPNRPH